MSVEFLSFVPNELAESNGALMQRHLCELRAVCRTAGVRVIFITPDGVDDGGKFRKLIGSDKSEWFTDISAEHWLDVAWRKIMETEYKAAYLGRRGKGERKRNRANRYGGGFKR